MFSARSSYSGLGVGLMVVSCGGHTDEVARGRTDEVRLEPPCVATPAEGGWVNGEFDARSGPFTIGVTAAPSVAPTDALFGLSRGPADAYADLAAIVRFNPDGAIDARDGSAYRADATVSYAANGWRRFALVVDPASRTYDVRLMDNPRETLATHYAFRDEQASVTELDHFAAKVDGDGVITLCNIDLEPSGGCDVALPSGGFVNETFGARANAFRASFKVTPSADRMDGVVGLSLRAAYAFSDLAAAVRWNPDGFIDVRGANAYAADVPIPYVSGETYKVDVLVDVIAHAYSVFVDGRMLARNYAFRSQQASVPSLGTEAVIVDSPTGQLAVCDFTAPAAPALFLHDMRVYGDLPSPGGLSILPNGGVLMSYAGRTLTLDGEGNVVGETPHGGILSQDAAGNIYLLGEFENSYDGGGGPVSAAGGVDVYVSKYDASWHHLWTRAVGGTNDDHLVSSSVSPDGDVALLIGPSAYQVLPGQSLVRLDPDGTTVGSEPSTYQDVALVSGGGWVLAARKPDVGIEIAKFASTGAASWTRDLPQTGATIDFLRTDANGNVIFAGTLNGSIDFGGGQVFNGRAAEDHIAYVAKLDQDGAYVFATTTTMNSIRDFKIDPAGNAVVSGMHYNVDMPRLNIVDPSGRIMFQRSGEDLVYPLFLGSGGAVASDGRVRVYWGFEARAGSDSASYFAKLSL